MAKEALVKDVEFDAVTAARVRRILVERFPKAFAGWGESKPPLKIGIFDDLVAALPELPVAEIQQGLQDYTSGPTYTSSLTEGANRINLNGEPVGVVSADHAAFAVRFACWRRWSGRPRKTKKPAIATAPPPQVTTPKAIVVERRRLTRVGAFRTQ